MVSSDYMPLSVINQNDANSCQFLETFKSLCSTSSLGNNPMIKHKSTNLDLADSAEIDTTFQPPTDTKDESLIHPNIEESTLTTDSSFRALNQQSEPVACAVVGSKFLSLETNPESNKTDEDPNETGEHNNVDDESKKKKNLNTLAQKNCL